MRQSQQYNPVGRGAIYFVSLTKLTKSRYEARRNPQILWKINITTTSNLDYESAKLRAMSAIRAYVFCVLSCFACLVCLRALRASKICVPCVLTCFACLRVCVLTCFALIVISKFTCQYNTAESNSHSA